MAIGEWRTRLRVGLVAAVGVVAILAAAPTGAWAHQVNDSGTTTDATGGGLLGRLVVAPVTTAVQAKLDCAPNVNVLGSQRDGGNCAPDPQSNASCPINVNVLADQRGSGNCAPGPQANANTADTRVSAGAHGPLGSPLVAPVTNGIGVNVTCPTNVNVLSSVRDSGDCPGTDGASDAPPPPPAGSETPPDAEMVATSDAATSAAAVVPTGFTAAPGPSDAGATAIVRRSVGSFPALSLLVLVVLVSAAIAARRLHRGR